MTIHTLCKAARKTQPVERCKPLMAGEEEGEKAYFAL